MLRCLPFLLLLVACASAQAEDWTLDVTRPSREVIFSNKIATHIAVDTGAREQRSYAGLFTSMHESLDDWVWALDGRSLEPEAATRARVTPWQMDREHDRGIRETVFLPDEQTVLLVRLEAGDSGAQRWSLTPRIDMRWIWKVEQARFEAQWVEVDGQAGLAIHRPGWHPGPGAPSWLVVAVNAEFDWEAAARNLRFEHPRDLARKAMERTHPREVIRLEGDLRGKPIDAAFALGDSPESALALAHRALSERDRWLRAKRGRIEALAASPGFESGDARLDLAYRWARASMDVLITRARGDGIYAGFHWFPNYWGRDTFICLPGATLVTGQLDTARAILRSFLDFQLVDRAHPRLGRLPNIVQPDQLQYASIDGTWWYVRAAYRYVQARRSAGDADHVYEAELAAALEIMIEGAERFAVDEHGLLRHGDGETWMDAGGEANPFSPRGDRAVEVQALYYNGLRVAEWLAREQGQDPSRYAKLADRTAESFARMFWNDETGRLVDHLNVDGSQDEQVRPNTILALTAVEESWPPPLEEHQYEAVVDLAYERLVLPWGVTSLDPADPAFHPRHLDLANYYYDEAYHNGDVWYWLSGPMMTALCRVGRVEDARRMMEPLIAETLDHGAVGAIREIRDGADTGVTEDFGGATFQAWSMAEWIRALHEDVGPAMGWVP